MIHNKHLRTFVILICMTCTCAISMAQIPEGYYSSLKGKSGANLKNAVYEIIKKADVLSYGSGKGHTWDGFWQTDRTSDGKFIDRYSPESSWVKSTKQGDVGAGMNIEHSFPKSWWGGSKNQAYCDLYNLMPCESGINSKKSNYPMGKVVSGDKGNGATKVGKGSDEKYYWEPSDEWKGDFARGYMYMATCYQNLSWIGTGLQILESNNYPTLQKWAYELYMEWARADKPTELEITRNNAVSKIQGNRNPFVDFPNLMEYIWGDSTDCAFDPAKTVCTENYKGGDSGGETPSDPSYEIIKEYNFTKGDCDFTYKDIENPLNNSLWTVTEKYGWKVSGYSNKTKYTTNTYLISPEIDLSKYSNVLMELNQAVNFMEGKSATDLLSVSVECDGAITPLNDNIKWPAGKDWNFVQSENINLDQFAGKTIQIVFNYTSNTDVAPTWEIKNLSLKGIKTTTGISETKFNDFNATEPYETFTVDGQRINTANKEKGIIIVKQNGKSWKITR